MTGDRGPGPTRLRLAFVGKGGSGKSSLAGTAARLLAQRGEPVLVVDADPMPGLAFALGVARTDVGVPDDAVDEAAPGSPGPRFRLRMTPEEAVERYAVHGPDGVRVLQMGKLRGAAFARVRSQQAFRRIVDDLDTTAWHVITDIAAGTRQPAFGWARSAPSWLAVVEPGAASAMSARRLARLVGTSAGPARLAVVVNKVRHPEEVEAVAARTGLPVVGAVPWDEELRAADQAGLAPVDRCPGAPGVEAVRSLVAGLLGDATP